MWSTMRFRRRVANRGVDGDHRSYDKEQAALTKSRRLNRTSSSIRQAAKAATGMGSQNSMGTFRR